eukprot:UC1_evm3s2071
MSTVAPALSGGKEAGGGGGGVRGGFRLVGFGESMIRYAPVAAVEGLSDTMTMLRTVGGDEMNVCVALKRLNRPNVSARWISVLPEGPLGDVVYDCGINGNLDMTGVLRVPNADVGTFTVLPEAKTVVYQRRRSAFSEQDPNAWDWDAEFKGGDDGSGSNVVGPTWLHMTGITPMISAPSRTAWTAALEAAHAAGVPVSIDFNHRKQLGTLDELWACIAPQLTRLQLLIISVGSLRELALAQGVAVPGDGVPLEDASYRQLLATLRSKWRVARLATCFKVRATDGTGTQMRWSAVADAAGVHTTLRTPTKHRPRDECGGGSAYAAGMIDSMMTRGFTFSHGAAAGPATVADEDIFESPLATAARHGDLLAALCQETVGDHSQVTVQQLEGVEAKAVGTTADLLEISPFLSKSGSGSGAASSDFPSGPHQARLSETLACCKRAGVLAIIRAKNEELAIERAVELCSFGCRAIEVTLDSTNWRRVLTEIIRRVPASVCVGVGTVMDKAVVPELAKLGARFALSPIAPKGFIQACHDHGIVAVPAGLSSNELWDFYLQGARLIKLFHAGLVGPKILKSMLGVSPLAAMNIAPSGGCSPSNASEWWDAGACVIGMGSNLAGKDISKPPGHPELEAAQKAWQESGRGIAQALFKQVAERFA